MALSEKVRKTLALRSTTGERKPPSVFVGRKDELEFLESVVQEVEGAGELPIGTSFRLMHGAPGAGKSALCVEFMRRINASKGRTVAVTIDPATLRQPALWLTKEIAEQVRQVEAARKSRPKIMKKTANAFKGIWETGQRFVKSEGLRKLKEDRHGMSDKADLRACLSFFSREVLAPERCIAVCIDEVQACDAEDKNLCDNLQALYNGKHDGRVSLLCFGLPDSEAVLRKMNMSRIDQAPKKRLGQMKPGEGRAVLERNLSAEGIFMLNPEWMACVRGMGLNSKEWADWHGQLLDRLEAASDEFPQHLSAGVAAACKAILDADEQGVMLDESHIDLAEKLHREDREGYYEGRLSNPDIAEKRYAIGAICMLLSERRKALGEDTHVLKEEARSLLSTCDDSGDKVPSSESAVALQCALDEGVLGEGKAKDEIGPPPIPSMESYAIRWFMHRLESERPAAKKMYAALKDMMKPKRSAPKGPGGTRF